MLSAKEASLLAALEPKATQEGVEIVNVEVVGPKKSPIVRVYIDTPDGVSFDELSSAQAWINSIMDDLDPFPGAYLLEVSSPGVDRPLRTPEHFRRFAGEQAVVRTKSPLNGRSNYTGELKGFDTETSSVLMEVDETSVSIPFDLIKRANVKGTIDFSS